MIPDWLLGELPTLSVFIVLAAATFAGCAMRGFTGFGAGLLMAPIFSLLMPPADVLVLVLGISQLTMFQMLPEALRTVDWRIVLRLLIPSLLGVPIGLAMVQYVDPGIMRKTVSSIVIVIALLMLSGWHYTGRRGLFQDGLVGMISGVMTALAGIGGPPVILYLLSDRTLTYTTMRAVNIVYFGIGQVIPLVPLAIGGMLTARQGVWILALLPIAIVASLLGALLHRWSIGKREDILERTSLLLLLFVGIMAFII